MQTFFQDLRYGARMLIKNPVFTLITVITLGIGIGANTAIFTVVNATLLNGLPYREPDRLVHLWERTPQKDFPRREASYPDYLDWRENNVFNGTAAYGGGGFILSGRDGPEAISGAPVTANFFSVLGVEPFLGRAFQEGEDRPGAPRVLMLTYKAWQQRFGGDKNIAGQTLRLNDESCTIIGVLPPSFHFAPRGASEIWVPLNPNETRRTNRRMHWVNVIARLKPGVSPTHAETEMNTIGRRIEQQYPESHAGTSILVEPLQLVIIGNVKPLLIALLVAVGFVLLIACANVAGLMLVRAAAREKEMAIRLALGAGRWQIARQLLTESLLLAVMGGALGLLMAKWGVDAMIAAIPDVRLSAMPFLHDLAPGEGILLFTGLLTLLTAILFGLAPAIQASKPSLQESLKEGGRTAQVTGHQRLRQGLVVAEIALALVLLIGAGLVTRSLIRLLQVDPGFNMNNLLTLSVSVTGQKYNDSKALAIFHQQLIAQVGSVPGVRGAATVDLLPLVGGNTSRFYVAGRPVPAPGDETEVNVREISANYFQVMEVPLIEGRGFTENDNAGAPQVIIVNRTLARRAFRNEEAVGQRLIFPGGNNNVLEIVGVVGDEKVNGLAAQTTPVVYEPFLQGGDRSVVLMVRTAGDPMQFASTISRAVRTMEPGAVIRFTRSMDDIAANMPATFLRRYSALLIGIFSLIALLLAAIGIYGVMSYSVTRRTHEIGVRMALGAQKRDVLKLVVKQGMRLALTGVSIGLATSFALTWLIKSLLFGVSATDPLTFAAVALILVVVALLACCIPARRAAKVDPIEALRASGS